MVEREGEKAGEVEARQAGAERETPWGIASEAEDMKCTPTGVGDAGAEERREAPAAWSPSKATWREGATSL